MILKFFLFVIIVTTNEVFGGTLSNATLEEYPYMAIVAGTYPYSCPAVIISEKHVLVLAQCVYGESEVTVFLGNLYFPSTSTVTQSYKSSIIYRHDYYDLAIVEMYQPIIQSNTVHPGTLISVDIANELKEGAILGNVGWFRGRDTLMQDTLVMQPSNSCTSIFGDAFSSPTEWCFQEGCSGAYMGNVMTVDNMIAGLMTKATKCHSSRTCSQKCGFLNLALCSDWISNKTQTSDSQSYWTPKIQEKKPFLFDTQVPINSDYYWSSSNQRKTTPHYDLDESFATDSKIETSAKTVKETNNKCERETVSINTKLEKIINMIQNMSKSQSDMFDYKTQEIKEEINNVRSQKDQHSDERDSKYDQKYQDVNNNLKIFEQKLYDKIKEVNNRINDEISQNSENTEGKLERQKDFFLDPGKQVQKTNNEITNVGNDERIHYKDLQKEIKDLKTEINTIKTDQVMKDDEIELKLNSLRDHASNKHNNRLDDLETQINLLSMEMGSMNTTINKILEYIGKSPASN